MTAKGFDAQVAQWQKVDNVRLRFVDVKSVKGKHGMSPATKILIATGALLAFSFWAGNSCEDRFEHLSVWQTLQVPKKPNGNPGSWIP